MAGKIIADIIEAPYDSIRMNVANVTVLTANNSGLTYLPTGNVNVNIGTTASLTLGNVTVSNLITANGGIKFPATQVASGDANTLDDYEEGTWTPVIRGGTTAGTYVFESERTGGRYTKIGRVVHIWGVIRITSITSAGTGSLNITGFPFTAGTRLASSWHNSEDMQVDIYGTSGSSSTQAAYPPPFKCVALEGSTNFAVQSYGKNQVVDTVIGTLTGSSWIYLINGSYTVD